MEYAVFIINVHITIFLMYVLKILTKTSSPSLKRLPDQFKQKQLKVLLQHHHKEAVKIIFNLIVCLFTVKAM